MDNNLQLAQKKINHFSPDLLKQLLEIMDEMLIPKSTNIPEFQREEVMDRLNFHRKNSNSNFHFFESKEDLENILA